MSRLVGKVTVNITFLIEKGESRMGVFDGRLMSRKEIYKNTVNVRLTIDK